jgi:hypothetical protein
LAFLFESWRGCRLGHRPQRADRPRDYCAFAGELRAARARARKKVFDALTNGLTAAERAALEKLLTIDPELRRSRFAWLRDYHRRSGTGAADGNACGSGRQP